MPSPSSARTGRRSSRRRSTRGLAVSARSRTPIRRPGQPARRSRTRGRPRSPTFATSVGGSPSPTRSGRSTRRRRRTTAASSGEHVRVVPFGGDQHRDVRPVRVEVARVLVRLDDEVRPGAEPRHAALRPGDRGWAARPRRTPTGRARQPTRMSSIQPAVVDLPCVPVTADQAPPARRCRVGDDLLDALGLDAQRAGGPSSGWSGSTEVIALVTATRSTSGRPVGAEDVRRRRSPTRSGSRPPRRRGSADPARPHRTRSRSRPTAAAWRAAPADAAPPTPMTWMPRPGRDRPRRRGGARPAAISSEVRVTAGAHSSGRSHVSSSSAAAALARCSPPVAGPVEPRTSVAAAVGDGDVDEPDRLLVRPAVRPGDAGDPRPRGPPRGATGRRPPSPARPGRSPRLGPRTSGGTSSRPALTALV